MTDTTKVPEGKVTKPAPAKPAPAKPREQRTYKAPHDVYTGGVLYRAGQPFTTSEPKGKAWEAIGKREKVATEATDPNPGGDPNYETLDAAGLLAVCAAKSIDPGPVKDKEGLIAILKAEHAPNG